MKSIAKIKDELTTASDDELQRLLSVYEADTRSGVQKLVAKIRKDEEKMVAERARMYQMKAYEREYASFGGICGIDEVGRGPLAGPVVACAVILPVDEEILYLNDSKQLSAKKKRRTVQCDPGKSGFYRHRNC